jgi:long-chain fatty acid transport protein
MLVPHAVMTKAHPLIIAATLSFAIPTQSFALGLRVPEQDTRAMARGNAFVATADNPSAVYYNPAGISMLYQGASLQRHSVSLSPNGKGYVAPEEPQFDGESGLRSRLNFLGITLETEFSPSGGGRGFDIKRDFQVVPSSYMTYRSPGSRFTFGFGSYAPYGLGIEWPEDNQFRRQSIGGELMYLSFNPVVAYQVSDTLSIAAGATINYGRAKLKRGVIAPHDMFEFDGEGWALGWNAGLMWRPSEKHSFGVNYRSQTDINFEGDSHLAINSFKIPTPGGSVTVPAVESRQNADVGIKFPQHVMVGYSYRPTPKWNLEVNADWTDWDNLNTLFLRQRTGDIALDFNYESSWMYSAGASYLLDNGLTASVGYIFSENSVPNQSFNPGVPDSTRHVFTAGVGGQYRGWDWDVALQWAHGPARTIAQGSPADGDYEFNSHAISFGLGSKF